MLFLLNKTIIEIDGPEAYLARHWKRIGCGEPIALYASDAVNFAVMVVNEHLSDGLQLEPETATDLAALLIAKTGANAALFTGEAGVKLNVLPEVVLEGLQQALGGGEEEAADAFWETAA